MRIALTNFSYIGCNAYVYGITLYFKHIEAFTRDMKRGLCQRASQLLSLGNSEDIQAM